MKKFNLITILFFTILFNSCGDQRQVDFTRVIIRKPDKAILDGGIFFGAQNVEGIGEQYGAFLDDEEDFAVLEIPNGSYRFGGIGYTKNATSGNKISDNLRCGASEEGKVYTLNGQTLELNLTFSKAICESEFFAKSTERDPGDATKIPLVEFGSCSGALPTAAGGTCAAGSAGFVLALYQLEVGGRKIQSNAFAIGAGDNTPTGGATLLIRIPPGNGVVFPVVFFNGSKSYLFSKGLSHGVTTPTSAATGEGVAFFNSGTDRYEVFLKD